MTINRLWKLSACALATAALVNFAGLPTAAIEPPTRLSAFEPAKKDGEKKDVDKTKKPDITGIISAVANDGKAVTLELPSAVKGEAPPTKEIKITDKTKLVYFGVDGNGENLTVGYVAQVWFAEGSEDTAVAIRLGRKDGEGAKGPDFIGVIAEVSKDGKTLTVTIPPEDKTAEPKKMAVKLTDKTKFSYFGVDPGGESPAVGYVIQVWLAEGSKDTAVGVRMGMKK